MISAIGTCFHADAETVIRVLLADGWHLVYDKSFSVDDYQLRREGLPVYESPVVGFNFIEADEFGVAMNVLSGPLSSVLAIAEYGAP